MPKTHQPAITLALLHASHSILQKDIYLPEHMAAATAIMHQAWMHHNTSNTTPEGVTLVLGPLDGFWDVIPAANVLQHTQNGFIGTPVSRTP